MEAATIGRDAEIAEISGFLLAAPRSPAAMAITGDAGIGKTTVWRYLLRAASGLSRVLSCQPASAERPLAFSALDDLFGGVAREILPALAGPSRRAMEAVLLRDQSAEAPSPAPVKYGRPPPERRALARGVLDALRILSGDSPLVLAVDDAQWLDRPSARVLEFCIRRLDSEPVSILLTFRTEDAVPLGLDRALSPDRLARVHLGPLSLGAIGEILRSQLGEVLPRYALTRLYDASAGNPFYALEYARLLLGQPHISRTNEPIPIPRSLRDLVSDRLRRLGPDARRVGRLVAASPDPRERVIRAAYDDRESWTAIDRAIDDGILERDGDGLRFTHPLLRSVLYAEMTLSQRREIHQRLAAAVEGIEERAWHLALGADRPSEDIAQTLDSAARHAASRGAPEAAAALEEQGMRLTPVGRAAVLRDRTVRAADYYFRGGDLARSRELIESVLPACPHRAPLLARLATIDYHQSGWPVAEQTFLRAVEEAPDDPALCAHAEQELAFARMVAGDLPAASRWAATSLRSAERAAAPRLIAHSLARIALFEFLQGNGPQLDLLDRAEALEATAPEEPIGRLPMPDPPLVTGMVLKWCDRLDEARLRLASRYRLALDHGDEASLPFLLYHFSQLECWAGKWDAAEGYALEACRVANETHQQAMRPATLYSLALVRAHRGQVADARELANEALILCDHTGNVPVSTVVTAVLGFVALSLGDHEATHAQLSTLAGATAAVGLGEPSVVKFLPDEIEALAALGHVDLAQSFTRQLQARGKSLGRPWALATAARCRAHLAAIDGDFQQAGAAIEEALAVHSQLPMPFELGRTLLVKGMIERRAKYKSTARESLGQALSIFKDLGAPLWAVKADREISRIATRSPADGLTETERRIATLIAQGHTNREVASAMFVTENTVQTHVRHIFQKLRIRSRTELAARLLPGLAEPRERAGSPAGSGSPRASSLAGRLLLPAKCARTSLIQRIPTLAALPLWTRAGRWRTPSI
jgi:DNA-binding CsgD family transcriptional regulator